jgi:hypothetical protein
VAKLVVAAVVTVELLWLAAIAYGIAQLVRVL